MYVNICNIYHVLIQKDMLQLFIILEFQSNDTRKDALLWKYNN